ncbi:MAG: hypothetical protein IT324_18200 [Anaerolineae bacterium]|nr:hypothetical protein [Anaerolineae bacterium]
MNTLLGLPDKGSYSITVKVLLAILVVSLVVGLVLLVPESMTFTNGLIVMIALVVALLCAIGIMIAIFMGRTAARVERVLTTDHWTKWTYTADERKARPEAWQQQMDTAYIGPLGIGWSGGNRPRLDDFGNGLQDVQVRTDPAPVLRFTYTETQRHSSSTRTRGYDSIFGLIFLIADLIELFAPNQTTREILVPIPGDKQAEAEELVSRFRAGHLGIPSPSKRDVQMTTWATLGVVVVFTLAIAWITPALATRTAQAFPSLTPTPNITGTAAYSAAYDRAVALDKQLASAIPTWEKSASTTLTHLSADRAGLGADSGIKEVVYGLCQDNHFFAYVLDSKSAPSTSYSPSDTTGFALIRGSQPYDCKPTYWATDRAIPLFEGWYRIEMRTYGATVIPTLTALAQSRRTPVQTATVVPR